MRRWSVPVVLVASALAACPGQPDGDTGSDAQSETTGGVSDVSYAACDDPELGCALEDCRTRTDAGGAVWHVCVPTCNEDADCPIASGSNTPPICDVEGRCALECNVGVAVCPSGTTCIDGEPAQCMWPIDPGVATAEELCTAACEGCMAGMLLGWADCAVDCAADVADCEDAELTEALKCPGDLECSVGGLALSSCLQDLSCIG